MQKSVELTAMIEREGDGFVAVCPELDIASQGETIEEARANLVEALEGFFLTASAAELDASLPKELYVTRVQIPVA
jgi:predicted RNase H-like HicB family nuclease